MAICLERAKSKDAYKKTVTVDVSGSSEKLVEVDYEAGTSKTMMPLPENRSGNCSSTEAINGCLCGMSCNCKRSRKRDAFVQAVLEAAMAKHKYVMRIGIMFLEPSCRWNGKTLPDDTGCLCKTGSLVWEKAVVEAEV